MRAFAEANSCAPISKADLPHADTYSYIPDLKLPVDIPGRPVWVSESRGPKKCPRLVRRATVIGQETPAGDNKERRVGVRYASGSTYRVRPTLLDGILSANVQSTLYKGRGIVLVYSETAAYRRACVIHTGCEESVCEVGCAEGITCYKVWDTGDDHQRIPFGLDKSPTCIVEARRRYPQLSFHQADIFDSGFEWGAWQLPCVVAIDINGTRELEAVLHAVELLQRHWRPRLIIVKSRSLFHSINNSKQTDKKRKETTERNEKTLP